MHLLRVSPRNPRAWKAASDAIATFLTEGVFHFTEKGVWLQAIDPSMVVYVKLEAPREVFSEYELKHPEVRVPISIAEYQKVLSRLSAGDRLTLSFSSTNLYILMEGRGIRKEFVIPAIDLKEEGRPVTFPSSVAYVELPASYMKEALKNASVISREVSLKVQEGKFFVESREGSNVAMTEISPSPGVKIVFDRSVSSKYSIDYLQNILKAADASVTLEFSDDSPLKVSYSVEGIKLTFILAPLIL